MRFVRKIDPNIWLVLALSIFAWAPLLTPVYFFNAHDAKHSVFFLVEFDQTFRDGYWWPRWSPDFSFGYGYPLFNLYAPLAFYGAEIFHLLGLSLTASVKAMYILATIFAGLGMYGFVRRLYGAGAGVLAAVVYMYIPFHLVEIFVRSAYAEFVALAIIPFLFWAFTELIAAPSLRRLGLAGLAYGLPALTHHTSFFTFSPALMVYISYLILAKARLNLKSLIIHALYSMGSGILGIGLASIYLIPMLAEVRFIKVEQWTSGSYNYLQHFVYFSQFFSPEWGYGYAGAGLLDDFSFQLGIVATSLFLFATVTSIIHPYPHRNTAIFFMATTIVTILLMSPLADTLWQILPIASLVQFPWRLLAVTAFTMSIVAGGLITVVGGRRSAVSGQLTTSSLFLLSLVVILGSFSYTVPQYTEIPGWAETPLAVVNWDRASIVDRVGMVSVTEKQPQTSPLEAQYLNNEPLSAASIITGEGMIDVLHRGGASDRVRVNALTPVVVQFYRYQYPGWEVRLDGDPIAHRYESPFGLITVDVPAGEHLLLLQMGSTSPRMVGTAISLISSLIIFVLVIFSGHRPELTFHKSAP